MAGSRNVVLYPHFIVSGSGSRSRSSWCYEYLVWKKGGFQFVTLYWLGVIVVDISHIPYSRNWSSINIFLVSRQSDYDVLP